jgi:hypothetical protein
LFVISAASASLPLATWSTAAPAARKLRNRPSARTWSSSAIKMRMDVSSGLAGGFYVATDGPLCVRAHKRRTTKIRAGSF